LVSNGPFLQLPSPFCHPEGQPPLPYNDRFLFVIPRGNRPSLTTTLSFLSSRGATVPSLQRPFPFCHPEGQPSLPYNDRFLFVIPRGNRPFLTTTLSLLSSRGATALSLQRPFPCCHPEGQPPLPYNDPFLVVIPSEASGSAVRHSCAPLLPAHNLRNPHRILMETPTSPCHSGFSGVVRGTADPSASLPRISC
jgi:hypothetical protein